MGIKVLWFHRRLFLAHRGHWERREIVCCWFFSDVTPGLSFNGSNMTVTVSLIWFSYLLLWAGEDAADVRTMEVFLLGGGQSQAVLEEKWRQVGNEESGLSIPMCPVLCSWDAGKPRAMVNLMVCDLWAWLSKCELPWASVKSLCVQELLLCSVQMLLRATWGGSWL